MRVRLGDAVVATQGQFQSAAHAGAADGRDHRLAAAFHVVDYRVQVGFGKGFGRAELADVGAAGEGTVGADQYHGFHCIIGFCLLDTVNNTPAEFKAQAIDGRVVESDDGDVAVHIVMGSTHVAAP